MRPGPGVPIIIFARGVGAAQREIAQLDKIHKSLDSAAVTRPSAQAAGVITHIVNFWFVRRWGI